MTAILAIIKRLFASNKVSFMITAVVVLCATTSDDSKIALSNGNYTWLLAIMTPFLFVFYDYTKLIHLGTSKKDYFLGSLASYGLMAFLVSLVNTGIHVLIDPLNRTQTVINMMDLCGWTANGISSCTALYAALLVRVAVRWHISGDYLHFYTCCAA